AEPALREAGFELPLQTGNVVLAARVAPDAGADREERQSALDVARALVRRLAERPEAHPELTVTVAVHAGPVTVRGGQIVGGLLLRTADWPLATERDGVRLSAAAAAGLV